MSDRESMVFAPTGFGSVTGVPNLPEGFTDTFRSRYVTVDGLRLHAVTGGQGPGLLLLGGWPQSWYAWRFVMPTLARDFTVIAVDPRGTGLSDKPADGYDSATLATDLVRMMEELGCPRFAMVGHDVGMWTGYAMAVDHPGRIERLAVAEAIIPGVSPSPPLVDSRRMNDFLWHINFNRTHDINEQLVRGREGIYFGYQFATKAATPRSIPTYAVKYYVDALRDFDALRASFDYYRAIDEIIEQNEVRRRHKLALPVLAIAGGSACGDSVAIEMRSVAEDVTSVVIPECGHYVPEEAPEALLEALGQFLETNKTSF
ncbi:alpha/beta hydrolase [Saccharopolyspora karakumensis]|uniref:Alpha/beta hydrolase n=1 Tax=Saccharopolyspora karakumensis TaxID=2530386 RepID=A0A4R5B6F4_9PSEU|nr:alpha/beta hydrolase [Saccharopolyspora karakumensis]TDD80905.1 alpha/beta hydrolase [Saccharopolyspora karakumensis]